MTVSRPNTRPRIRPLLGAIVASALAPVAPAAELQSFLENHCLECHDSDVQKGGLNLESLKFEPNKPANHKLWAHVFDRVESGEMPPEKQERPDAEKQTAFLKALSAPLVAADRADKAAKGRVHVRRLTRREYENTVHDLLGIDRPLQELLPEDATTHGFETVAEGQQLSHFNLAAYLEAADIALGDAFDRALRGDRKFERKLNAAKLGKAGHRGGNYRGPETRGKVSVAWPMRLQFYGRMPATTVPESGWYRITLKGVHAINPKTESVWGTLRSGACFSNDPVLHMVGLVEATKERRDLTYEAWVRDDHMLELKPNDVTLKLAPSGAGGGNVGYKRRDLAKQGYSGIGVMGIEIERVYPNAKRWELRSQLIGGLSKEEATQLMKAGEDKAAPALRKAIANFAARAFRRPVDAAVVTPYVRLATDELKREGAKPVDGLRAAYRAILCSPRFLTFVEKPGRLDAHAVASRLSYMLWNSMPDRGLRALADDGSLMKTEARHAQVERMLKDPRSDRFIESFTDQWLNLSEIDFTTPDRRRFRTFDPIVQESMLAETRAFVKTLIRDDAPITNVIQSDFAMLNERLGRFYGIDGIKLNPGKGIQRVSLEGDDATLRGGLVTQGAVLKVTADGTTTSPIVRGVYIGERLLGLHIPPPPPNIPAVEPDIRGAVSIRDQLSKHRNSASCASCHQKIDPAGFALENFDPVGLWRTKYGTAKNAAVVDPSGITPEGRPFKGPWQWKSIYANRPVDLTKGFAQHLMTYATGAEPRFSDRVDILKIARQAKPKNYGMRRILHAVIASEAFLTK